MDKAVANTIMDAYHVPHCHWCSAVRAEAETQRSTGGTTRFFVSDTPDGFATQERLFMGSEAGGPVEQIAIETY